MAPARTSRATAPRSRCIRWRTRSTSRRRGTSPTACAGGSTAPRARPTATAWRSTAAGRSNPAMLIGAADVLADGTWSVDARDSSIPLTTCQCVTVVSDRGGQVVDFPLEKPQNLPPATVDPGRAAGPDARAVRRSRDRARGRRPARRDEVRRRAGRRPGHGGRGHGRVVRRARDGRGPDRRDARAPAGPDHRPTRRCSRPSRRSRAARR